MSLDDSALEDVDDLPDAQDKPAQKTKSHWRQSACVRQELFQARKTLERCY